MLAILKLKDNAYGVTIRELVIEWTQKPIVFGTMYNSLDKLAKKGYVISARGEPTSERGGRSKIFYTVSDLGHKELKRIKEFHLTVWDQIDGTGFSWN